MNAAKHAGSKSVTVKLKIDDSVIGLAVVDEGKGCIPTQSNHTPESFGWGMKIMQERAELIGAKFMVESAPEKGTVVSVNVPLEDG